MEAYENSSASTSQLPCYSPSPPSPDYSLKPASDEQLLEQTPRSSREASSLFIKKAGKTTVVLNNQEDEAKIPLYGRRASITGNLFLEQSESILDIAIKVEGKLETTSEGGSKTTKLVADSYTLWSHSTAQGSSCPSQLEFSVVLPATFKYSGEAVALPPSYNASYFSVPCLFLRSAYQLHLIVTRTRHKKMGIWPKTKHILIPFTYLPRTRPHRPIVPSPCFFSSVKTSPEEWYQAVTALKTRGKATIGPINCHLFMPGGRIYGIGDTIPFHLQLSGNICSLQELFSGTLLDRVMSIASHNTAESTKPQKTKPLIRVYLLRQISVASARDKSWKNTVIGEGTLWPIPPDLATCCSSDTQCREGHIDWEGELRCDSDVTAGGFVAANVTVKDFVVLSLSPPNPVVSQLQEMQMTIPVRLVTDSWAESTGPDHREMEASLHAV